MNGQKLKKSKKLFLSMGFYKLIDEENIISMPFASIPLTDASVMGSGWNGNTAYPPPNLSALVDGDSNSNTGWGVQQGIGYHAYVEVVLPQSYSCLLIKAKFGLKMFSDSPGGSGSWFVESRNGSNGYYTVNWQQTLKPGVSENIFDLFIWASGDRVRLGCEEVGQGRLMWQGYDLKAWSVNLP